jgi:hypothetical protein
MASQSQKTNKILAALQIEGHTPFACAKRFDVSVRYVYELIGKYPGTPTNKPIRPNSKYETQILRALVSNALSIESVALVFDQAPVNIKNLIKRLQAKTSHKGK